MASKKSVSRGKLLAPSSVLTYWDTDGWRIGIEGNPVTALAFATQAEASRMGTAVAARLGIAHTVLHAGRVFAEPFRASLYDGMLSVSGSVDQFSVAHLSEIALRGASRGPLTINLTAVDFLPSLAVSVLVTVLKESEHPVCLEASQGTLSKRVLEMSGLPHVAA